MEARLIVKYVDVVGLVKPRSLAATPSLVGTRCSQRSRQVTAFPCLCQRRQMPSLSKVLLATQWTRGVAVGLVPHAGQGTGAKQGACAYMNPPDWSAFETAKRERPIVFKGPAKHCNLKLIYTFQKHENKHS